MVASVIDDRSRVATVTEELCCDSFGRGETVSGRRTPWMPAPARGSFSEEYEKDSTVTSRIGPTSTVGRSASAGVITVFGTGRVDPRGDGEWNAGT